MFAMYINMFLFLSGNEIKRGIPSWNFTSYKLEILRMRKEFHI